MKIAPIDIAHKNFSRKMMGLDQDEVMEFLRMVSEEMEAVIRDRNNLRETLRDKELQILEFRERDELLKSTITTATKMSDKIQQDAERESKLILQDAQQQGDAIVRDARESLKKIFQEISDLKRVRMQYEHNLRALMQSHLAMMENSHKFMPDPELTASGMSMTNNNHHGHHQNHSAPISPLSHNPGIGAGIHPQTGFTTGSQNTTTTGVGIGTGSGTGSGTGTTDADKIRANVTEALKKSIQPLDV